MKQFQKLFLFFVVCLCATSMTHANVFQSVQNTINTKYNQPKAEQTGTFMQKCLARLYRLTQFQPIWLDSSGDWKPAVKVALSVLAAAENEGLEPQDYAEAQKAFDRAQQDPAQALEAELQLSAMVLRYVNDLSGERIDPRRLGAGLHIKPNQIDEVETVFRKMTEDPSAQWLEAYTFQNPHYQSMKKVLHRYLGHKEPKSWPILRADGALKPGMSGDAIRILQQQLTQLGLYSGPETGTFDDATEASVKTFQEQNGAEADGVVGSHTISLLNGYDAGERLKQIKISLERWRWMPEKMPTRFVMVNIASFMLQTSKEGAYDLEMPVIIGQKYRKTPVFASVIYEIRFNPSWHVPASIALKDKLHKIQSDPDYLANNHYVLTDSSGNVLSQNDVDWESVSGHFPFRLRQTPGDHNALGKIRFSITSPFDVYLHSTPDKHLFLKSVRTFSSGCIRVAEPSALAHFVFNNEDKWPLETVERHMEGNETQNIQLKNKVPVFITYFTVWQDKAGQYHFAKDIYGQDRVIEKAIQDLSNVRQTKETF